MTGVVLVTHIIIKKETFPCETEKTETEKTETEKIVP